MPIYEYKCTECGDKFDVMQSFSDKPLKKCKKCGGKLRKLVSECSFHLKGSGWYVTDYGKKDKTNQKVAFDNKKEGEKPKEDSSGKKDSSAGSKKKTGKDKQPRAKTA